MKHHTTPSNLQLGPARRQDLSALVSLIGGAVPGCSPDTVWQLPWTWRNYVVLRTDEGRIVAAGSLQRIEARRAEIRGLVVHEDWHGRGLASHLVEHLLREGDALGLQVVCVTTTPGFFRRLGFRETVATWLTPQRVKSEARGAPRVGMAARRPKRRGVAA